MRERILPAALILMALFGRCLAWPVWAADPVRYELRIERQPLDSALQEFSRQSGVQLVFFSKLVEGYEAPRLEGRFAAAEALKALLEGTSLTFHELNSKTIQVRPKATPDDGTTTSAQDSIDSVRVSRSAGEQREASLRARPKSALSAAVEEGKAGHLEEVLVTAQKREERLIEVPMSIVALSGEDLRRRRVSRIDDLTDAVPGLTIRSNGSVTRQIALRGISNGFGGSSLIGIYLDEASLTSALSAQLDVRAYDLERIEVLRGPQGTLYGEGSAGGTIRFITRPPVLDTFAASAMVDGSYVEDGAAGERIEAVVNVPLIANELAFRVAGTLDQQGGWIDQPAAGHKDINGQNTLDVRAKALWRPSPRMDASFMAVVHRNDAAPTTGEDASGNFAQVFNLTATPQAQDDYDVYNLTLSYDLPAVRLLMTSSYVSQVKDARFLGLHAQIFEPPIAPWDLLSAQTRDNRFFTEELRATSAGTGPWQWTIGAFFRDARMDLRVRTRTGPPGSPDEPLPAPTSSHRIDESRSRAVFGDSNYALTDRFSLGVGLRYFADEQDVLSPMLFQRQSGTFHSVNPRVHARYEFASTIVSYMSIAKGFRSGGFNTRPENPPYDPETVWTYELGAKMALAGGRLGAELALFLTSYDAYQIPGVRLDRPDLGNIISNAGDARIKGIEAALDWSPADGWKLGFNGNYLHSKFVSIDAADTDYIVGDSIDMFPKYRYTFTAQREFEWRSRAGYLRLDYSEQGRMTYRQRSNGPWYFDESDIINMLNLRMSIDLSNRLALGLSARNLLNDRGFTSAGIIESLASRNQPRTYGIDFAVSFE